MSANGRLFGVFDGHRVGTYHHVPSDAMYYVHAFLLLIQYHAVEVGRLCMMHFQPQYITTHATKHEGKKGSNCPLSV